MTTITTEQQQAITDILATMTLPKGMGTAENACSIAAINLALTGELTDRIPPCMSEVIGKWIIGAQDAMPAEMRNSSEWKQLLPLAAGTGRQREDDRLAIIMDWMWGTVLPTIQPIADRAGYGDKWRTMLLERTVDAASYAAAAYDAASYDAASYDAASYDAASRAAVAADVAAVASRAAYAASWQQFNPCGLLQTLIAA